MVVVLQADQEKPAAVVVVGGSGLVGSTLVRRWSAQLAGTDEAQRPVVVSPDRKPNHHAQVTVVADLTDPEAVESLLFHRFAVQAIILAVKPPLVGPSYQDFIEVNVSGICDLTRLAEKHRVRQLVYVSSVAASDHWVPHRGCREEDKESRPHFSDLRSPYDLSKALAEDFILQRHRPDGLRTVAIRIAGVYGGDADPYWHRRVPLGISFDYKPDDNTVDSNYVGNIAEAMLRVVQRLREDAAVGGRFYFYTHGDRFTNQQILSQMMARRMGRWHIGFLPASFIQVPIWCLIPFDVLPLLLPGLPTGWPCGPGGRAVTPKSYWSTLSMTDQGFTNQTFDDSTFKTTFGYSHAFTIEEAIEEMATEEAAARARGKYGTTAALVTAGLPLCLCASSILVARICSRKWATA